MKLTAVCYAIVTFFCCLGTISLFAQHDLSVYNMPEIPQRIFQNPSFIPQQKFYIGIPILSGLKSAYANPFTYKDIIERDAYDSVTFRIDNFLSKIAKNNQLRLYTDVEVISFGTQVAHGKFFLGFSVRERMSQHIAIPVNLCNLLWYGNASPQFFGQTVNIAPALNILAYDEWAASFSGFALKGKLTWGARLKYLSGRFNATTVKSQFEVNTDTSTYNIHMRSDFELRTSGVDDIQHYTNQRVSSLVFPGNNGMGVDLGASYQVNKHLGVSASVLDIGFITWKSRTMTFVSKNPGKEFAFDGLTLNDFVDMFDNMNSFGKKLSDSILALVKIDSVRGVKYTTWLPVRYNLGGTWSLNEHHTFGLLFNGISWDHHFFPAMSVSYCYRIPCLLGLMISYNLFNHQFTNVGAGLSINAGPIQLYAISDNVPGLIFYHSTNNSSVQVGINIAIRKKAAPVVAEEPN